jgi:hypothetical protein
MSLTVECRECGAKVGNPCLTLGRRTVRSEVHGVRRADARMVAQNRPGVPEPDLPCPYCHAAAGEPCRTAMGTIDRTGNPHYQRLQAVKRKAKIDGDPNQGALL